MQPTSDVCEPVSVRIKGKALAAVDAYAASDGITRSKFVALAVYRELTRRNQAVSEGGHDE